MSELKCCKRCGAFTTCTTKGECCPECEWFDPIDNICMAIPLTKEKPKSPKRDEEDEEVVTDEVDPETFLFEDDDEEEDDSDLPPERETDDDDSFDDDDW